MDMKARLKKATDKINSALSIPTGEAPDERDVLDTLKEEHDEVQELLSDLVESENLGERKSLLKQVKMALIPHTKAEERTVYDAVIAARGRKNQVDGAEGYLEHALASQTLTKLGKIAPVTSPEFTATAKVLKELVDHHIQEEEKNIWSDVREHFDGDARIAMNRRFLAAKKRIKVPNGS
ncbi:MAG TPA: hemerythrin domain-containing protein [Rhizomicrobium sp.]|nr:hemerythrin domain-containing protein [Rhizomicrobium sp.]HWC62719.1 hemerythrin domain-containing protein [Rhizomicrobium sp.]